jgi:hypothetical protein
MSARKRPRLTFSLFPLTLAAASVLGASCSSPTTPQGSPILTQVYWIAGGAQFLAWSYDQNPNMAAPVPPLASEIDFVFDRRLDGNKLEEISTVNGAIVTTPRQPSSVSVTWPGMTATSDFQMTVDYNSVARFGGISSFVFARPSPPGFPSSTLVTFKLDASLLTSSTGEHATVPASIPVKTEILSVTIGASTAPVARTYQVPLNFSNRLPAVPATSPFIHVRTRGADVPYKLLADGSLDSRWYLSAADCLGGWPGGATFDVTIDADFADAFGGKLGQPATASFSTNAGAAVDASCSVPDAATGGDAADGGVTTVDAGGDGAVEAGADATVEAGGDAAAEAGGDAAAEASAETSDAADAGVDGD